MSPLEPSDLASSIARFSLRIGRGVGAAMFLLALFALLYLRFVGLPVSLARSAWPSEHHYLAGADYQSSFQSLRDAVTAVHNAPTDQHRADRRRDVIVWRDVLNAKFGALSSTPRNASYLRTVAGFNSAIGPLTQFHSELDGLVDAAMRDREGLARFENACTEADRYAQGLVTDLRFAELGAFETAFASQRRSVLSYLEVGLWLLALIGAVTFLHFHSARKERLAFRERAAARAETQRSAQARTALLGMVSHELRTPLQTMLANVELLGLQNPRSLATDRIIEVLEYSIEMMSVQLDNIALYTRLASGVVEVRREEFSMLELLRRVVDEHTPAAKVNDQAISIQVDDGPDITVHGDAIRLHQVLNNYLTNSIKYSGPGRITVVARLLGHHFGEMPVVDAVEVIVEDEGPGIAASDVSLIWEPYVRGRSVNNPRKGTGLGLAVVKLLASSVGWEVGVRTEVGCGSTFYVILPLLGPVTAATSSLVPFKP